MVRSVSSEGFVSLDFRELNDLTRNLSAIEREALPATKRQTLNDAGVSVRSVAVKGTAKAMGARQKDVRQAVRLIKADYRNPRIILRATGRPLPLIAFGARQTKKGVTAKAWGKRRLYRGAFVATMRSGHTGAFVREGRKRLPIREMSGPSVPDEMAQPIIVAAMGTTFVRRMRVRWPVNLEFNIARILKR
ncbi:MAG: phage tail protein [Sphingomonadales bacterium]